jgi:hypothetical protein
LNVIGPLSTMLVGVFDLNSTNTQQDSRNVLAGCLECERRIKARASLLDKGEVKSRGVGDRLDASSLGISDRDCHGGVSVSFKGMAGRF